MKKILLVICLLSIIYSNSEAKTKIDTSREKAFSSNVIVSTTPVAFISTSTYLNLEEIRIWNYGTDTIYVNYSLPESSTTAAASGIKVFQSTKNTEFLSILINKAMTIYFTLAADSGTSSLRVEQFGREP